MITLVIALLVLVGLVLTVWRAELSVRSAIFLVAVAAVGVLAHFGRRAASRRSRQWVDRHDNGLCLHCGYDKRADPRGPCPECGRF